jgi:hypothetical protein
LWIISRHQNLSTIQDQIIMLLFKCTHPLQSTALLYYLLFQIVDVHFYFLSLKNDTVIYFLFYVLVNSCYRGAVTQSILSFKFCSVNKNTRTFLLTLIELKTILHITQIFGPISWLNQELGICILWSKQSFDDDDIDIHLIQTWGLCLMCCLYMRIQIQF